ncbi:hypothetical protein SODALDRAFT_325276 [Sodiomyces alkalinus F11]|uniref:Glycosyltransferase 2-like domain-containing protein n=1 Tax=Sodiomyces alkalinus (strain CBS 110278 / VKM F-3762 / F11) TaxID=1314773 RepID=A0A3N2PTC3_SODAK|nr:hypothetical protein SODALDRAFT_325276 [Sodiomyces alkalinus F11]ROT37738.1 hypothetical protein SODALDRAFT_325276 [Sodiomyces alkalinus F11]
MALALGALWYMAWSVYDKAVISHDVKKYQPVPLPENPSCNHGDVSIIVPTIDTESTFTEYMRLWLKSKPPRVEQLQEDRDKILMLCAPLANKRYQLVIGVKAARGRILALVDDDVYSRVDSTVPYLLAPFEDTEVGAVAGIQSAEIPSDRQDERVITTWEATAAFDLYQWKGSREVHFAAERGCWCLSARTLLIRASILQDECFADAYTHEVIGRRVVNTADDVVLTGWVFDRAWKVSIQDILPRHPYTTGKMVERLARPIWTFAYAGAWFQTLRTTPWLACMFAMKYFF